MTLITQHFDSLSADLMRLNFMTHEISDNLVEQTRLLRRRDLGLPEATVQNAEELSEELDKLTQQLQEDQTELAHLRALAHTAALINSTLDLNEVLSRAMDTVIGLTDAERGYILLRNEETGEMEFMIGRRIGRESVLDGEFIISRSIVEQVIQTGVPVVTTNAQEDARFSSQESVMSYSLRSILCVPLIYRDEVNGVVYADNRIKYALFGERELQLLLAFANQASTAIQNARLYERVKARLAEVTEKQQLLDSIFSSIASGVITTNQVGYVHTYSPVAEIILSTPAKETLGQSLTSVLPALYEGFEQVLTSVQNHDTQEIIEISTINPQRGPAHLSLKLSALKGEHNDTMGVAVVVDDLTEIKQRDETLNVIRTYLSAEMVNNIQSIEGLGLGGEEREITVLSADVRGFTSFSERLEPELVMEVINQYMALGSDSIQQHGGIIDKFMGDAVVGLFNTQLNPHDNHPLLAVQTAVRIARDLEALHDSLPEEHCLWFGIGIHTDMAVLGNVGSPSRKEFTGLGNAVTFAKKLQEIAENGEIILSEETYRAVQDDVEAERTERQLRGSDKVVVV
jgi:adenylate cyclase